MKKEMKWLCVASAISPMIIFGATGFQIYNIVSNKKNDEPIEPPIDNKFEPSILDILNLKFNSDIWAYDNFNTTLVSESLIIESINPKLSLTNFKFNVGRSNEFIKMYEIGYYPFLTILNYENSSPIEIYKLVDKNSVLGFEKSFDINLPNYEFLEKTYYNTIVPLINDPQNPNSLYSLFNKSFDIKKYPYLFAYSPQYLISNNTNDERLLNFLFHKDTTFNIDIFKFEDYDTYSYQNKNLFEYSFKMSNKTLNQNLIAKISFNPVSTTPASSFFGRYTYNGNYLDILTKDYYSILFPIESLKYELNFYDGKDNNIINFNNKNNYNLKFDLIDYPKIN